MGSTARCVELQQNCNIPLWTVLDSISGYSSLYFSWGQFSLVCVGLDLLPSFCFNWELLQGGNGKFIVLFIVPKPRVDSLWKEKTEMLT